MPNLDFSLEKFEFIEECPTYKWRYVNYMDLRYDLLGMMDLYHLM